MQFNKKIKRIIILKAMIKLNDPLGYWIFFSNIYALAQDSPLHGNFIVDIGMLSLH